MNSAIAVSTYSAFTVKGDKMGPNQDSYIKWTSDNNFYCTVVCDGHGELGLEAADISCQQALCNFE